MCGIIGHIVETGDKPDISAVNKGLSLLAHRGPDGKGIENFANASLGHRRLSIIDLEHSHQPWRSDDGRYAIVFNGEIYNYLELRDELKKSGFQFTSHGDTEVLLNLFIHLGIACLDKLNGMYAFAIWDNEERTLFAARDRLGKKPLYYSNTRAGFIFASELSALHAFSFLDTQIDLKSVHNFFSHQYIGKNRTIYQGVNKLSPGHYLIFRKSSIRIEKYWSPPRPKETQRSTKDLGEQLVTLVADAVKIRQRSDVPLGAFLSGGVDSAIVVANMANSATLNTFTVGFSQSSFDESSEARKTADFYHTNHRASIVDMDVTSNLGQCLNAFGEPFADPSAIPTWYLCEHTKRYVTVALSGDGVDEIFGGYKRYFARQWVERLRFIPPVLRITLLERLSKLIPERDTYYADNNLKKIKLFIHLMRRLEESPRDPLTQVFSRSERERLFVDGPVVCDSEDYITALNLTDVDYLSQMFLVDTQNYLPDDILTKVDRISMQHALEVRSPFLDYRIVEFASSLPAHLKINRGIQKFLLKEAFRDTIPKAVLQRKKHGFAVPVGYWFKNILKAEFESVVFDSDFPDMINKREILNLWSEHQKGYVDYGLKLWTIFSFFYWYRTQFSAL